MHPHKSVLLEELVGYFTNQQLRYFVDGTLGAGGHSLRILEEHPEIVKLIGIDQDPVARDIASTRLSAWKEKVAIIPGNFSEIKEILENQNIAQVDGIILDIGVSSMQFDQPEKGFSFMKEGPLDMRMDPSNPLTAAEIVNTWEEGDLGRIFRNYGEEKFWRVAARAILRARANAPIKTTTELAAILHQGMPYQKKGIHPATLVFQALRICVNAELEVLEKVIPDAINLLAPGGLLAVISFHSLEDRIVKNAFRYAASDKEDTSGIGGVFLDKDPTVRLVTRKPIIPGDDEVKANPRSRSAKLRVVEKR